jgi:flagellar hook-associated protein 1 FlgK
VPNLVDSFQASAHSLSTYQQAIQVVSNDTTNATTPGYASQTAVFSADSFSLAGGGAGGVSLGAVLSSRDAYAERTVQTAQSAASYSDTLSNVLQSVEGAFPLATSNSTGGGIGGSLNQFFASVSNLTTSPNSAANRQTFLDSANTLAASVNDTFTALDSARSHSINQGQQDVATLNNLVAQIQKINVAKQQNPSARNDAGLDAQLNSDLESISQLANVTTSENSDGTTNIYLDGQGALLLSTTQNKLSGVLTGSALTGQLKILDANGGDVTSLVTGGKIGALIQLSNTTIPGYVSQLNTFAQNLADTVNSKLTSGVDQNGNPGLALFTYDPTAPAKTLATTAITASQVAAATSANPGGGNNATNIFNLSTAAQAGLGGVNYTSYYGNLAALVGSDSSNAQSSQATEQQVLSQAQNLRSNISGVSLDTEAAKLTEYQQAYNATGKLLNVVEQMMQTVLNIVPSN